MRLLAPGNWDRALSSPFTSTIVEDRGGEMAVGGFERGRSSVGEKKRNSYRDGLNIIVMGRYFGIHVRFNLTCE